MRIMWMIALWGMACLVPAASQQVVTIEQARERLARLDAEIAASAAPAPLYVRRGNYHLELLEFDQALADFNKALALDPGQDHAHFGRGLALGRMGELDGGIAALTTFIELHPDNAAAYTKRGVRYLWAGNDAAAEHDLSRALALDASSAEAHDDIGVVFARRGDYGRAIYHFTRTVTLDPTYLKGFHNLGMAYYLSERDSLALDSVERALALNPQQRNTLLLKAQILRSTGQLEEAARVAEEAEFLPPSGDWSEQVPVQ